MYGYNQQQADIAFSTAAGYGNYSSNPVSYTAKGQRQIQADTQRPATSAYGTAATYSYTAPTYQEYSHSASTAQQPASSAVATPMIGKGSATNQHYAGYEATVVSATSSCLQTKNTGQTNNWMYNGMKIHGGYGDSSSGGNYSKRSHALGHQRGDDIQRFFCEICKINCTGAQSFKDHQDGKSHKKKEAGVNAARTLPHGVVSFNCELCDVLCSSQETFDAHVKGAKHAKRLALLMKLNKPIPLTQDSPLASGRGASIPMVGSVPMKKVVGVMGMNFVRGGSNMSSRNKEHNFVAALGNVSRVKPSNWKQHNHLVDMEVWGDRYQNCNQYYAQQASQIAQKSKLSQQLCPLYPINRTTEMNDEILYELIFWMPLTSLPIVSFVNRRFSLICNWNLNNRKIVIPPLQIRGESLSNLGRPNWGPRPRDQTIGKLRIERLDHHLETIQFAEVEPPKKFKLSGLALYDVISDETLEFLKVSKCLFTNAILSLNKLSIFSPNGYWSDEFTEEFIGVFDHCHAIQLCDISADLMRKFLVNEAFTNCTNLTVTFTSSHQKTINTYIRYTEPIIEWLHLLPPTDGSKKYRQLMLKFSIPKNYYLIELISSIKKKFNEAQSCGKFIMRIPPNSTIGLFHLNDLRIENQLTCETLTMGFIMDDFEGLRYYEVKRCKKGEEANFRYEPINKAEHPHVKGKRLRKCQE